jgi:hypothetical protein
MILHSFRGGGVATTHLFVVNVIYVVAVTVKSHLDNLGRKRTL